MGIAFASFRTVFRKVDRSKYAPERIAALGKMYGKWQVISLPFFFLYWIAIAFGLTVLFCSLGRWTATWHAPGQFILVPGRPYWSLLAIILGIVSSAIPLHATFKALLGDRYEDYSLWSDIQAGYEGWPIYKFVAELALCGAGLAVAAGLNWWVVARDDCVELMRPWYWEASVYPYERVKDLTHIASARVMSGNIVDRDLYAIRFDDGVTWTTDEIADMPGSNRDRDLFAFLSKKSGKPIQQLEYLEDLKP